MRTTSRASSGRVRAALGAFGSVIVAVALFAPSASAADFWSGTWNTKHKFGEPKLKLDLIKKDGDDVIKGQYFSEKNGDLIGNIRGTREKDGGVETWTGTFRDIGATDSKGKFSVELQSDQVSFSGWFKTCGLTNNDWSCSKRYNWSGNHA